jgi:hypothetical protein
METNRNNQLFKLFFEPDTSVQVEMVGGFVKEEEGGLYIECPGQGHPHPPASGEILTRSLLHLR